MQAGSGRRILLGRELGRGGEGAVYALEDDPTAVAKVYHDAPGPEQVLKLRAMVAAGGPRLHKVAAWPTDLVHERFGGPVAGFLMPRVSDHRPLHDLYNPKARQQAFPGADWAFLVHAAGNVARAFRVIHEHGQVIGDVNHANVVVSRHGTAMLVDCDSFQVVASGRCFPCQVGVATHQPPEFQGLPTFRGLLRAPRHDAFGLAVLVFQLLFQGRHPFAGQYLGAGDMTIGQGIGELRFAYGGLAATRQMRPPPHSLPIDAVSRPVAALFERAFSRAGVQGAAARPSAAEWADALDGLRASLRPCQRRAGHVFLSSLEACPWCGIEDATGVVLFGAPGAFDVQATWRDIVAVEPPPPPRAPAASGGPAAPSAAARAVGTRRRRAFGASLALAAIGVVGAASTFAVRHRPSPWILLVSLLVAAGLAAWAWLDPRRRGLARTLRAARTAYAAAKSRYEGGADRRFRSKRAQLERARAAYLAVPAARTERAALERTLVSGARELRAAIQQDDPVRSRLLAQLDAAAAELARAEAEWTAA